MQHPLERQMSEEVTKVLDHYSVLLVPVSKVEWHQSFQRGLGLSS